MLPINNEIFAMKDGQRVKDSKGKFDSSASIINIDVKKWQFVGIALKYRVFRNMFVQCMHLVSSRINNNVYKKSRGFLCQSFPAYKPHYMSATFLSQKLNSEKTNFNGFIYGGNLANDILHIHYYSEGNVFLNFEMNPKSANFRIKNYARKFDEGNDG